jgi:hypothetical protein
MRSTRFVIALGLAAAILMVGAFTVIAAPALHLVSATTPAPKATPKPGAAKAQAYCDAFIADLARRLGVSQDKLRSSVKDSLKQGIDDAVAKGDLTAAQATKLKAKIDAAKGCQQIGGLGVFSGHQGGVGGTHLNLLAQLTTAAATALQQTPDVVRKDIMAGQTLHQIADLKGVKKADFDTAFRAGLKAQSDPQVTAGKLTAAQQTRLIDQAVAMADKLWDSSLKDLGGAWSGKRVAPPAGTKPSTSIQ